MKLFTGVRIIFSSLIFIGLVVGMQACGGGGGSTPAPTDQDASGIYTSGTLNITSSGVVTNTHSDFVGMIYNNKFMLFSIDGHILYEGTINSITLKDYSATVSVYKDGVFEENNISVSGTITTESTFTGTLAGGNHAYSEGNFSVNYDAIYKNVPTFARIEGANFTGTGYSTTDLNTNFGFRETNENLVGFLSEPGSDPKCTYTSPNSSLTIPTSDRNIYNTSSVSILENLNCPIISSGYSGIATLLNNSVNTTDDKVFVAITNGTNSVFAIATR